MRYFNLKTENSEKEIGESEIKRMVGIAVKQLNADKLTCSRLQGNNNKNNGPDAPKYAAAF